MDLSCKRFVTPFPLTHSGRLSPSNLPEEGLSPLVNEAGREVKSFRPDQRVKTSVSASKPARVAVNRPKPTDATAKQLYACAISCAYPGCVEPLYRMGTGTQARALNSRIAHICARSEGGPRWDANMTSEANRSAENLMLLCLKHADEVDQPHLNAKYQTPDLLQWKRSQIAAYDHVVEMVGSTETVGWHLSDAEAAEVIEASSQEVTITMKAHIIQIGGSGGNLGGSGGGGGVVGTGVLIGGAGGDEQVPDIALAGQPGTYPGGGGRGGGVLVDNAVAARLHSGIEGEGYVAGIDGADSGPATFSGGDLAITAQGGKGGLVGSGERVMSDRFAVSALLLADYVKLTNGLATVVAGAWSNYSILNIPAPVNLPLFAVIEGGGVEPGEYTITFELVSPSGDVRATTRIAVVVQRKGDMSRIPCALDLAGNVHEFGIWRVVVRSDVAELAALDVMVKLVASSAG